MLSCSVVRCLLQVQVDLSLEKTLLRFFFPIHFFAAQDALEVMSVTDILTFREEKDKKDNAMFLFA